MKLYLSSYRLGNKTEELKKWIKEHDNKILVVINSLDKYPDGERKSNNILEKCKDLEELGFDYKLLDLRDYFGKKDELFDYLEKYHAVFVLGGNVFVLRIAMKLSGFDDFLRQNATNTDYLYSGYSAGICVLAKDLYGLELVDDYSINPYGYEGVIWEGIGLIDYLPIPHYDTSDHPEYHLIMDTVNMLEEKGIVYKTLRDGEVIIEEIK